MIPYEATMVGFGGAMVGLLVWGVRWFACLGRVKQHASKN
jgi:hypothetical protein